MDVGPGLLWTVMPMDLVVDGLLPPPAPRLEMQVGGRILQVIPGSGGSGTIERLISTDPRDYLDPAWQPGSQIALPNMR